ncbi:MAG: type 4a pilus biogenesis protein PilO [Candidatus Omnitrophota bacterium]
MEKLELTEKNKNRLLNLGIILLAVFIAFQIYKNADLEVKELDKKKANELKRNQEMEQIANLEVKIESYKRVFTKKDISYVLDSVSKIAKNAQVKFVSIKPMDSEASLDYIKSAFLITVTSPTYHALANFINQVESSVDLYIVGEVSITSSNLGYSMGQEQDNSDLTLNLKINTILLNNENQ